MPSTLAGLAELADVTWTLCGSSEAASHGFSDSIGRSIYGSTSQARRFLSPLVVGDLAGARGSRGSSRLNGLVAAGNDSYQDYPGIWCYHDNLQARIVIAPDGTRTKSGRVDGARIAYAAGAQTVRMGVVEEVK